MRIVSAWLDELAKQMQTRNGDFDAPGPMKVILKQVGEFMAAMKDKGYFDVDYTAVCKYEVLYVLISLQFVAVIFLAVAIFSFYRKFKSFMVERKYNRETNELRCETPPRFVQPPNYDRL